MSESARFIAKSYAHRNTILKALGFRGYESYIESLKWFMIRNRVITGNGTKCAACGDIARSVHHAKNATG